jgi:prohibitin 1
MQFTKAVEAKQVAQQDAERARFVVLKADQVCYLFSSLL